jgi:hypothetical protein
MTRPQRRPSGARRRLGCRPRARRAVAVVGFESCWRRPRPGPAGTAAAVTTGVGGSDAAVGARGLPQDAFGRRGRRGARVRLPRPGRLEPWPPTLERRRSSRPRWSRCWPRASVAPWPTSPPPAFSVEAFRTHAATCRARADVRQASRSDDQQGDGEDEEKLAGPMLKASLVRLQSGSAGLACPEDGGPW